MEGKTLSPAPWIFYFVHFRCIGMFVRCCPFDSMFEIKGKLPESGGAHSNFIPPMMRTPGLRGREMLLT